MITCRICGGLGNQLFQIITTIAYALRNKKDYWFLYTKKYQNSQVDTGRKSYWDTFFSSNQLLSQNVYVFTPVSIKDISPFQYNENGFDYKPIPDIKHDNIQLYGYFQSYKYFLDEFENISKILEIEKRRMFVCEKYMDEIELLNGLSLTNPTPFDFSKTASIHFRLGDYKKYPLIHPVIPEIYYIKSIQYLCEKTNNNIQCILYFHENNVNEFEDIQTVRERISHLRNIFPKIEFIEVDVRNTSNFQDWEEMLLMSCCHYNVIANSTFSWWGGFLNSFSDKIVIYPEKWFGDGSNIKKTDDLFPDTWVKMKYV